MNEEIENGVNVDDFLDGAEDQAGSDVTESQEEVTEVGEEATEKPAEDAKPEEKPDVSVTDLFDGDDTVDDEQEDKPHGSGYVPEADHIKLRKRAQAAEAKVKELESQDTRTDAENSGLEIDDDDFLTGKDAKNLAAKITADAEANADSRYEAKKAKDLVKARTTKAKADQEVMLAEVPDYLDVIGAMSRLQLSPASIAEIKNADNAAQKAYEIGCQILNRKPAQKRKATDTPTNENKNNAEPTTEEEIFDDLYG